MMPKGPNLPKDWQDRFLAALRNSGNVRAACQAAKVERMTAYRHRKKSPVFAQKWEDALQDAVDVLEAVAWKRAQDISDTLLIFLLKAHRPDVYSDKVRLEIVRREAERMAEGTGFTADEIIAEAEEMLRRNGVR